MNPARADAYLEHAPAQGLVGAVRCTWSRAIASQQRAVITPDGCVDLVVSARGSVLVAGPDTGPQVADLSRGVVVGLRFQIGAAGAILGLPAAALRDQRVPLGEIWDDSAARLEEHLALSTSSAARRRLLEEAVAERLSTGVPADALVVAAAERLESRKCTVAELGGHFGVSERQLLRRFDTAIGYGPKTLERVLRFRRLTVALRAQGRRDLAALAHDVGYADQSHMTRDCVNLAGATPKALQAAHSTT